MAPRDELNTDVAFRELFVASYGNLHRYAYTMLKNEAAAEDVVQAVFARLWEKRAEMVSDAGVRSYLYRSVHNRCLNELRHQRQGDRYATYKTAGRRTEASHWQPQEQVAAKELETRIAAAMASLPEQCRLVFVKSRQEGRKYAEIAADMGISVKTVEAQMSKALRMLRLQLQDYLVCLIIFWLNTTGS